eukprot:5398384-Pyramimonas_sp.AAC.1
MRLCEPLHHFLHFVQQKRAPGDLQSVAQVAFGGADRISTEIESLLDNSKWSDILDEFPDLAP